MSKHSLSRLTVKVVVLLSILLTARPGLAALRCAAALTEMTPVAAESWDDLPSALEPQIGPALRNQILNHRQTRRLRIKYGDGAGRTFAISVAGSQHISGWSIQGEFLGEILQLMFPKARIVKGDEASRAYRQHDHVAGWTRFRPVDALMTTGRMDPDAWVEMSLLKAVNPGPTALSRPQLRYRMNLPQEARIAALYKGIGISETGTLAAIKALFEDAGAHIVILSDQWNIVDLEATLRGPLAREDIDLVLSEEELPDLEGLSLSRRTVIVNESRGRLPSIYGASDFAFIMAHGNSFEPQRAGIPTYIMRSSALSPYLRKSTPAGWDTVAAISARAGAHFVTLENLGATVRATENLPVTPPENAEVRPGVTTLDVLLTQIDAVLDQ